MKVAHGMTIGVYLDRHPERVHLRRSDGAPIEGVANLACAIAIEAGYRLYCARWPASRESRREHVTTLAVASLFGGAPWQGRL